MRNVALADFLGKESGRNHLGSWLFVFVAEAHEERRVTKVEAGVRLVTLCKSVIHVFESGDPADLTAVAQILSV